MYNGRRALVADGLPLVAAFAEVEEKAKGHGDRRCKTPGAGGPDDEGLPEGQEHGKGKSNGGQAQSCGGDQAVP